MYNIESLNIEIRKYLNPIFKRKYLFIATSLFVMSVIVWGSYFLPTKYEAKSTIFVETNVIKQLVSGIAITPSMEDRIRVLRYAMLGRGLISKVLSDLDLDIKEKNVEEKITDLQNRTQISVKGNDLFIVSIQDHNPKLAMDYINTLVRRYVEENITAKKEEASGANRFLGEQLAVYKEKLDKADAEIIKYRREKGIYMPIDEASIINEIKSYKTDVEKINIKRNELLATKNSIKNQLKGEEPLTVAITKTSSSSANSSISALENRINQLLIKYTENYPEVIKLRAEIEAIKRLQTTKPLTESASNVNNLGEPEMSTINPIFQDLKQKLLQTEAEIDALDAKRNHIAVLIGRKEAELRNIPVDKKKFSDLSDEKNAYKNIYDQLMRRVSQSEVSKQMEIEDKASTFRIVDPAIFPIKPVSPDRVKIILAGIFLGFLGGFGGVLLRERIDSSVKDTETLRSLGVQILAVIPKIFNEEENEKEIKKQKLVYTVAGSYFLIICFSLIHEIIGLTYIDTIFNSLRIFK